MDSRPELNSRSTTRVAVLGLYSSGSSPIAGILHRLGVRMGKRFHHSHFEDQQLAILARRWWNEPTLVESIPPATRVAELRDWVGNLEHDGYKFVGGKHPLLLLAADDLMAAWGNQTKLIWSWRPLGQSVASLQRRAWWPENDERIQLRLWEAANRFFQNRSHCKICYRELLESPALQVERLIDYLGICPTARQIQSAVKSIKRSKRDQHAHC